MSTPPTAAAPSYTILDTYRWIDEGLPPRVFVTNLKEDANLPVLRQIFEQIGPIHSIVLNTDQSATSQTSTAVVHYCSAQSAQRAIKELHNFIFNRRQLKLRKDGRRLSYPSTLRTNMCEQMANSLFGFNGWSSSILELTTLENGSAYCKVALHILRTDQIVVSTTQQEIFGVHTEPPSEDPARNLRLLKIACERAKQRVFEKVQCLRIQYNEHPETTKLVVLIDDNATTGMDAPEVADSVVVDSVTYTSYGDDDDDDGDSDGNE